MARDEVTEERHMKIERARLLLELAGAHLQFKEVERARERITEAHILLDELESEGVES